MWKKKKALPESLNICLVANRFQILSRSTDHGFLWPIARGLAKQGHKVTIISTKSPIGKAIAYTLKRWDKLTVFTTNSIIEIDNNRIENAIRPLALGRKNYLFVGSDEGGKRAAMMYSFFASCKIHHLNPLEWLTDVLRRIPNQPINQIDELLPHKWG